MLIECPSCKSRYRIRDEKLPANGGNIRCPNCSHIFFVSRENSLDDETTTSGDAAVTSDAAAADGAPKQPEKWKLRNAIGLVFDFADLEQLQRWLATRESFDGLEVSRDGGGSWSSVADQPELREIRSSGKKTVLGMQSITSTSPGTTDTSGLSSPNNPAPISADQMREQAQARIQSARASRGTTQMTPPPERREGSGLSPRTTSSRPSTNTTGSGKQTTKKGFQRLRNEQTDEGSPLARAAIIIGIPLVVFGVLQLAGVIDIRTIFGGGGGMTAEQMAQYAGNDVPGQIGQGGDPNAQRNAPTEAPVEVPRVAQLLQLAAVAYDRNELSTAIGHLEQATAIAPDDRETFCQLERLYSEAGRTADAARAAARCNPVEGSDAPPAEGSAAPTAP